jgi:hypothetical protein
VAVAGTMHFIQFMTALFRLSAMFSVTLDCDTQIFFGLVDSPLTSGLGHYHLGRADHSSNGECYYGKNFEGTSHCFSFFFVRYFLEMEVKIIKMKLPSPIRGTNKSVRSARREIRCR